MEKVVHLFSRISKPYFISNFYTGQNLNEFKFQIWIHLTSLGNSNPGTVAGADPSAARPLCPHRPHYS
jgi:hypothetical protein